MKVETIHIIENARRRAVIKVLRELGGEACLREVVRRVAEVEGGSARGLTESVRVSMLQTHIPKMRSAGLIEYDRVTDTVHLLELPPEFRYYLEAVERRDIPWGFYYLVLSVFGVVVSLVLGNFLAVVLASSFVVAALIHVSQTYGLCNESLQWCKHTLRKYLNLHRKKMEEKE
jgi:hypothetical protein